MFSTAGATARSGVPGASRATVSMAAMTVDARLVHLHLFHPVGRLDADAAGVEADALADDRQMPPEGVLLALPAGAHDDHPGRVVAALAHRQEHAHAELARAVGLDDVDPQAVALGDRPGLVGEDRRADVVRGAVGERLRAVFAPSPMIRPRSAALASAAASPPGATRISSSSAGGAVSTLCRGRSPGARTCPRPRPGRGAPRRPRRHRRYGSAGPPARSRGCVTWLPPSRRSMEAPM